MRLVVASSGAPEALARSVRAVVAKLDPELPLAVQPLRDGLDRSLAARRALNFLLAAFALTAVLLAAIGIYGVVSLDVKRRVAEFGVRQALGARPDEVLRLVLRQGLVLALGGVALGLAGAAALTRLLRGLLFGVSAADPPIYLGVAVALTAVTLAACYLPARRATSVDPIEALRDGSA